MLNIEQLKGLTQEELIAKLSEAEAKLAAQPKRIGTITMKVGAKGGVSLYGLTSRFPVTLYKSQWDRVIELVKSGKLEAFMAENSEALAVKATAATPAQ